MVVTGCSVIFVLVQVDGVGVLEVPRHRALDPKLLHQLSELDGDDLSSLLKDFWRYLISNRCFPSLELLIIFSGFPSVLGDRQESLEPGAEAYLGWLTGRSVEKLA